MSHSTLRTSRRAAWMALAAGLGTLAAAPAHAQSGPLAPVFIDTQAGGAAINARAEVAGRHTHWPCADHACLPITEAVVWRRSQRLPLPTPPGFSAQPVAVAADGMVAGTLIDGLGTGARAVVWHRGAHGYQMQDLGTLPGTDRAEAAGLTADGRVVGTSYASAWLGPVKPFVWTKAAGMADLAARGAPAEAVDAVSPGGRVLSRSRSWLLDEPAAAQPLPAAPAGYLTPAAFGGAINDAGDLALFLRTTGAQNLAYLHRHHHDTGWQLLSAAPNGALARWGVGGMDAGADISATVQGGGVWAEGPHGAAQAVAPFVSPAYGDMAVTAAGAFDPRAGLLAQAVIGRSARLVRLVPVAPCTGACLRVAALTLTATFIDDPADPGHCTPLARSRVQARLRLTDAAGQPLAAVGVRARWLDDYDGNQPVSGRSGADGWLTLTQEGAACVGAVALLVESASRAGGWRLDRTTGQLTGSVVPLPGAP